MNEHHQPDNLIIWTRIKLDAFTETQAKARALDEDTFEFEGNEFDTQYAKYLIEYLETRIAHE